MHDTAVGTANFTECVPAPTDEGSQVAGDRRTVDTEPNHGMQRRPPVVGGSASLASEPVSARQTRKYRLPGWAAV